MPVFGKVMPNDDIVIFTLERNGKGVFTLLSFRSSNDSRVVIMASVLVGSGVVVLILSWFALLVGSLIYMYVKEKV